MNVRVVYSLFAAATIVGCGSKDTVDSTDVNEDKIYGQYSTRYDADSAKMEYFTQFRLGGSTGTTIRLKDPSKVTVTDRGMQLQDGTTNAVNLIGTYYTLDESISAPSDKYTFKWTRTDGKSFENSVTMAKAVTVASPAANSTYSKASGDLTITFDGEDVRSDENAFFYIQSDQTTKDGEVASRSKMVNAGKQGIITKSDMANFVKGPAYVYVLRKRSESTLTLHKNQSGSAMSVADRRCRWGRS